MCTGKRPITWWRSVPSKIKSELVGSGMTAHTRRRKTYDMTQPLTAEEGEEMRNFFRGVGKHDPIAKAKGLAERTLAAIAAGDTDPEDFKERAGMGWYSQAIIDRCTWLDQENEQGNNERAQRLAFEIGVLVTEAQFKAAWDADVETAVKNSQTRERVNAQNSIATAEERKALVAAIRSERICGVSEACKIAAQRHPEKGAASTFRTAYYKKL